MFLNQIVLEMKISGELKVSRRKDEGEILFQFRNIL